MGDAFGQALRDCYRNQLAEAPVHRRDDGVSWEVTDLFEHYLVGPEEWSDEDIDALEALSEPMLDLGCGAGRHALYLQDRGDVLAVDRSPLAVRVASNRGVDRTIVGDMLQLPLRGTFEGVLVAGGQLGVLGSIEGLRDVLERIARITTPGGTLVADQLDPSGIEDPDRRAYLEANEIRDGASARRFRVEYDGVVGPWIDLLMLEPSVFRDAVVDTEWAVTDILERTASYSAVLQRVGD